MAQFGARQVRTMGTGVIEYRIREAAGLPFTYKSVALERGAAIAVASRMRSMITSESRRLVRTYAAAEADPESIRNWLRDLGVQGGVIVSCPAYSEAIKLDFSDFVMRYDELWYPSSDDTWISPESLKWLLELSHEEVFALYA